MTWPLILTIICSMFAISDLFTFRNIRLHRTLFWILFSGMYICSITTYLFGSDVGYYWGHFEQTPPITAFTPPLDYPVEIGYTLFVSLCKTIGLSLYGTFVIIFSITYLAFGLLFSKFTYMRCIIWLFLFHFCFAIFYVTVRQSFAVAMFIFIILALHKKKYIWVFICSILLVLFHKSGILILTLLGIVGYLFRYHFSPKWYLLCIIIILLEVCTPLTTILLFLLRVLPQDLYFTFFYHFTNERTLSVHLLFFIMFMYIGYRYDDGSNKLFSITYFLGCLILACCYRYPLFLLRFAYYIYPFIGMYSITLLFQWLQNGTTIQHKKRTLCILVYCLIFIIYIPIASYRQDHIIRQQGNQQYDYSSIFEFKNHSEKALQYRQIIERQGHYELVISTRFIQRNDQLLEKEEDTTN